MSFYEDEILRELEVGEVYTAYQLRFFLTDNDNVILLLDDSQINDISNIKYKVRNKIEKYIHQQSPINYRTYLIPNSKSVIYEIE